MPPYNIYLYPADSQGNADEIISELNGYKNLPDGWDMGYGLAPKDVTIGKAITIYQIAKYYGLETEPSPLTAGGISLTIYLRDNFLDIYLYSVEYFDYKIEKGFGKPYQIIKRDSHVSIKEIEKLIVQTKSEWEFNLSGQSHWENTRPVKSDLMTPKLFNLTKGESQFLTFPASHPRQKLLATI